MTRLLHLTDLHFGAERQDLVEPLAEAIAQADPDLIVVSGDLTHRARPGQFRAAVAFIRRFGRPAIAVPGNHDIPLWNIGLRLSAPFRRWRDWMPVDLRADGLSFGDFRLFAANTADPMRIRPGILREGDIRRIEAGLATVPTDAFSVLICHHPIEEPPGFDRGETRHAAQGVARLIRHGLDISLSGHLHHWQLGLGVTAEHARPLLQIQSGTALCARTGEKHHGFALLESHANAVSVTPWLVDEGDRRFHPAKAACFRRGEGGWLRLRATAGNSMIA